MISIIVMKELKAIILSPKFTATFAVCSLLMLLSVYVGIKEYYTSTKQYETATQLANQEMRETASWMGLTAWVQYCLRQTKAVIASSQGKLRF